MQFSAAELLERNLLAVFGERDTTSRQAALVTLWSPQGVFVDPDGRYVGLEAIDRRIDELQAGFPGFVFVARGSGPCWRSTCPSRSWRG